MTAPATDLLEIHKRRITAALATVRGARDCYDHCPSQDNADALASAERHLDGLLADQRIKRTETT